ncbi:hypothetical protein EDC94DRAFT_616963 [Helicostylum pulchrum]|nr:hypothetical protein EDC94DRAFT_616963 [Helicostylum pulchrum]
MSKRQRITIEATNETACSSFDAIISKIAQTVSGVENSSTAADTEVDTQRDDKVDDDWKELENVVFKEFEEKIIYLDQEEYKQSKNDNTVALFLSNITNIPSKQLSDDCLLLLEKIGNCEPSSRLIRSTIRSHALTMEGPFDIVCHDDLNFTELLCTHFLNLIDSPRNPLQQQQLERNAAFLTTIPILHNLFISRNDVIDMQWVERQARSTGNVKWDGIAFQVKNKKITPLFVELSGGIDFNSGTEKEKGDEEKLIKHFIKTLKVKKAEGIEIPSQFYIRYHDLNIYFESLTYYEDHFIKRTYIVLTCPSTPRELKKFAEKIPQIFQYRQGILDQLSTN